MCEEYEQLIKDALQTELCLSQELIDAIVERIKPEVVEVHLVVKIHEPLADKFGYIVDKLL